MVDRGFAIHRETNAGAAQPGWDLRSMLLRLVRRRNSSVLVAESWLNALSCLKGLCGLSPCELVLQNFESCALFDWPEFCGFVEDSDQGSHAARRRPRCVWTGFDLRAW